MGIFGILENILKYYLLELCILKLKCRLVINFLDFLTNKNKHNALNIKKNKKFKYNQN